VVLNNDIFIPPRTSQILRIEGEIKEIKYINSLVKHLGVNISSSNEVDNKNLEVYNGSGRTITLRQRQKLCELKDDKKTPINNNRIKLREKKYILKGTKF